MSSGFALRSGKSYVGSTPKQMGNASRLQPNRKTRSE